MPKKSTQRDKDAKSFESILTEENKAIIERVLDSMVGLPSHSVHLAFDALRFIIGKRPSILLTNLIEAYNTDFIEDLKGISPETRKYLSLLYANYGHRLHGTLHPKNVAYPHAWRRLHSVSTRYDMSFKAPFVKLEIIKENNECAAIEDSFDGWVQLLSRIFETLTEESVEIAKFQKNLGVKESHLKELRESVKTFDRAVSLQKT